MPRSPGPAPKDPTQLARPQNGKDGWVEIENTTIEGEIPPIPTWLGDEEQVGPEAREVYDYLMRLPQARLYGHGDLLTIWLTLPLIQRYLETTKGSGVETYKGIMSVLGPAVNLTGNDLAKARVKIINLLDQDQEGVVDEDDEKVVHMNDRRKRLSGEAKQARS